MMDDTQNILKELAAYCQEEGLDEHTLRLWSAGKCIGGPEVRIGLETPRTCAAIADFLHAQHSAERVTP
jgi:uncharacterized protein YbbK (DUF523 family)